MRIAIPVVGNDVSTDLESCEAIKFYEDDHGRILRQFLVPVEGGAGAALEVVEQHGVDTLVCGPLSPEENRALAMTGLLISTGHAGGADTAAKAFLNVAIACDPNNTCNYCGHKDNCTLEHKKTDG